MCRLNHRQPVSPAHVFRPARASTTSPGTGLISPNASFRSMRHWPMSRRSVTRSGYCQGRIVGPHSPLAEWFILTSHHYSALTVHYPRAEQTTAIPEQSRTRSHMSERPGPCSWAQPFTRVSKYGHGRHPVAARHGRQCQGKTAQCCQPAATWRTGTGGSTGHRIQLGPATLRRATVPELKLYPVPRVMTCITSPVSDSRRMTAIMAVP
jgi:hypothetical protein